MVYSIHSLKASDHLTKLGSKKLSVFVLQHGPIEIPARYGDDPLMGLCRIVIGQQLSGRAAHSIWTRLVTEYPERQARLAAFASPEAILSGVSNSKRNTLQVIALLGDSGIERLCRLPSEQRDAELVALKGIGPWSLAMWRLFVLGDADCWSDGDLILKRVSAQLAEEIGVERRAWVEKAAPYRSYLALYLWAMKDQGVLSDVAIR